jgi:hypothetical protein
MAEQAGAGLKRDYSSAGLERTPDKREVGGSSPLNPTLVRTAPDFVMTTGF